MDNLFTNRIGCDAPHRNRSKKLFSLSSNSVELHRRKVATRIEQTVVKSIIAQSSAITGQACGDLAHSLNSLVG